MVVLAGTFSPARAAAEGPAPGEPSPAELRASAPHALVALSVGRGLRFNNPYRLASPLGDDAESVSLSATYLDLTVGMLSAAVDGFRHGGAVSAVFALHGIGQLGLTPSYLLQHALTPELGLRGRLGVPIVVTPDTTLGLEAGMGPIIELGFGLGVSVELVGSVFFGAATEQTSITTIPLLSLQLGLCFDHEVLL